MDGGLRFAYRASWCAEGCQTAWNGDWRIIGDRGTLLYTADQNLRGEVVAGDEGFHRRTAPLNVVPSDLAHPTMRGTLRDVLRFLRTGQRPQTECHDNIKSLAMVLAAIESATEWQRVNIN